MRHILNEKDLEIDLKRIYDAQKISDSLKKQIINLAKQVRDLFLDEGFRKGTANISEFAKKLNVIGFDINPERIEMMKNNIDPSNELIESDFDGCSIEFTSNLQDLNAAKFFIIAVPTPIDRNKKPNIKPLISASSTVGKVLKKGDYVVFESTVYPGCTEDDLSLIHI